MERKRDLIISWRYASLTMIRGGGGGAIKRGFTVFASSLQSRSQKKDWLARNQDNVYD